MLFLQGRSNLTQSARRNRHSIITLEYQKAFILLQTYFPSCNRRNQLHSLVSTFIISTICVHVFVWGAFMEKQRGSGDTTAVHVTGLAPLDRMRITTLQ